MRMIEIRALIHEITPFLDISVTDVGSGNFKISGFREAFSAIERFQRASVFTNIIDQILSIEVVRLSGNDSVVVPQVTANQLSSLINQLRSKTTILVEALDELLPQQPEESISMRLPEMVNLDSVGKFLSDIEKMLSQSLVNKYLNGDIRLLAFDRGTLWVDVAVGSQATLIFFTTMVRFYYECREREIKLKTKEEAFKDLKLQVEHRQSIRKAIEAQIKTEQDVSFNKLLKDANIPHDDNEYRERLKHSISMLGKMLEDGLQIHPALDSETKATEILPNPMKLLGLLKQIPGRKNDGNEETSIQKDG